MAEARCLARCRKAGLDTPALLLLDVPRSTLFMERIAGGVTIKEQLRALYSAPAGAAAQRGGFDVDSDDDEEEGGGGREVDGGAGAAGGGDLNNSYSYSAQAAVRPSD